MELTLILWRPVNGIIAFINEHKAIKQYKGIERKLFKQLLAELLLADLNYNDIEQFILRLSAYLKKSDEAMEMPKELKSNLSKMEKLMSA